MMPSRADDRGTVLEPGTSAEATLRVGEQDTAPAFGSGDVPVLATPRLIALCEEATVLAITDLLDGSATSVGTRIEVDHRAPSMIEDQVTAMAELAEVDGRKLAFDVVVHAADGSIVAEGCIHRVVVDRARFLSK